MRRLIVCSMLMMLVVSHRAYAGSEVDYQFSAEAFESSEVSEVLRTPIELKDRSWAAPGVEECDVDFDQRESTGVSRGFLSQRIRLEAEGVTYGPSWLDEAAWPRTKQMFHAAYYDSQLFTFGGLTLQR